MSNDQRAETSDTFSNDHPVPEVENVLPGWHDAVRSAGTPNSANSGTLKLPTGEFVSAVYDVAADFNRRLSNWWHSHRLEEIPQDLTKSINESESSTEFTDVNDTATNQKTDNNNNNNNNNESTTSAPSGVDSLASSSSLLSASFTYRNLWLLGNRYTMTNELPREFRLDFYSRIWCTYRSDFEAIGETEYTSDAGWGCMLRTGQSLFAQALLFHYIGRDWRCGPTNKKTIEEYAKILSWFHDSAEAPFSLHNIALLGEKHGKKVGEWFGPFTVANVIHQLNEKFDKSPLHIHVASDGVIYRDLIPGAGKATPETCTAKQSLLSAQLAQTLGRSTPKNQTALNDSEFKPTLILLAIRLGTDKLNPIYHPAVKMCLAFPQSVGIAGGRPSASLYFIGFDDDLFFLDPHCTRTTVTTKNYNNYTEEDLASYHCPRPRSIRIHRLDPCMLIGFYCRDRDDFDDLCRRARLVAELGTPIFSIEPSAPVYDDDSSVVSLGGSDSFIL
ncbi:hypothetical protein BDF19DRAFT_103956 [Syncephalis fuscata]|nr:hypothetical protein BDF19DRAFT_103956 [Syncephalis fuscata]